MSASVFLEQIRTHVGPACFAASVGFTFLLSLRRVASTVKMPKLPPIAKIKPSKVYFGFNPANPSEYRGPNPMNPPLVREDPYYWLRDDERKDPEALAYLNAENDYCMQELQPLKGFQAELYSEMLSHLKESDEDVPYRNGNFLYYSKTVQGLSYKIHCRKGLDAGATEQVVLDENEVAKGFEYSDLGDWEPSPSHKLLAYSVDRTGYETYSIFVKSITSTGTSSKEEITGSSGSIHWLGDDTGFVYFTMDDEHRPDKAWLHILNTPQSDDILLLEENDQMFWMGGSKSSDDRYLFLSTSSKETDEIHFLDLSSLISLTNPEQIKTQAKAGLTCLATRVPGSRCEQVEHVNGWFFFLSNRAGAAVNGQLLRCQASGYSGESSWQPLRPYDPLVQLEELQSFRSHVAVLGRRDGLPQLWLLSNNQITVGEQQAASAAEWKPVPFAEPCYSLAIAANCHFEANSLRVSYSSFVTPRQVMEIDLSTGERTVLKEAEVPGGYDREEYIVKRMHVMSQDGQHRIPLSLVHHRSALNKDGVLAHAPCLLYGYGSYGASIDASFDFKRLAMLDRGVLYVIAHVRGGGEQGRELYEKQGKYLTKLNTFLDFADAAKQLIAAQLTLSDRLCIVGRSAGGLLVGATVNMYPTLFKACVADVPFVDCITTMSDPTIPLTVTEWEEVREKSYFVYYFTMIDICYVYM